MSPFAPAGAVVGRGDELSLLTDLLRESAQGAGSAVMTEGEPGIGKSTLAATSLGDRPVRTPN